MNVKAVKIGGKDYKVTEMPDAFVSDFKAINGDVNYEKSEIRLNTQTSSDFWGELLTHEILHAIGYEYNVLFGNEEENIVTALAKGVWQVYKDNFYKG